MINVFMQFIYCFLFLLYSSFISASAGWAVTLIWAMMILPIADVLMNCLQNLTSRIAGLDNNESSMRAIGLGSTLGSAFGYSIGAIKTQFTGTNKNNSNDNQRDTTTFMGKVKNFINPQMNLSPEEDYNGNINPIRNVINIPKTTNEAVSENSQAIKNINHINTINRNENTTMPKRVIPTVYKCTRGYLAIGAKMAEGNFERKSDYGQERSTKCNSTIVEKTLNEKINSEKESDTNEI